MDFRTILKMKRRLIVKLAAIPLLALAIASCDRTVDRQFGPPPDVTPPPIPSGVITTTMDHQVLIEWNAVSMDPSYNDLAGYKVYRSINNQDFSLIATVGFDVTSYLDEGLVNGTTYFYAVSSFDFAGNYSDLSSDNAFDTPRPEGTVTLYTLNDPSYEDRSGFDFSREIRVTWDNPEANFYIQYNSDPHVQTFYIYVPQDGSRIQDMGYTQNFDEITFAPETGWSSQGICEAIVGHTYVIKTSDNHYAKVRAITFSSNPTFNMEFDWGYQVDPGNRELKVAPPSGKISNQIKGGTF
jgi:hypothetical protein